MAQLKAGSTVGGAPIATDAPGVVPTAALTITGTKEFGKYVIVQGGSLTYTSGQTGGTNKAFTTGGGDWPGFTTIDSFPFASTPVTATSAGSLTSARTGPTGHSSTTRGFSVGGGANPGGPYFTAINAFPFTSPFTTASVVGDLALGRVYAASQQTSTIAYASGGAAPSVSTNIESFPMFATPSFRATSVGSLTQARQQAMGQSSSVEGFTSGGTTGSVVSTIDRFPFSAPFTTASSAGALSQVRFEGSAASSSTEGFTVGGYTGSVVSAVIDKFPFSATFTTATSAGSLALATYGNVGQISTTDGYSSGGANSGFQIISTIFKFPIASPFTTASSIGNLSQARLWASGQQY